VPVSVSVPDIAQSEFLRENPPIQLLKSVDPPLRRKVLDDPFPPGSSESFPEIRIIDQSGESCSEGVGVPWRHHQADLTVDHQLPVATAVGCYHRPLHCHRLTDGAGHPGAGPRGIHHHVASGEHLGHIRAKGQRHDAADETGFAHRFFDLRSPGLRFAADKEETRGGRSRGDEAEGSHQIGPSLPVANRHLTNDDVFGAEPELEPYHSAVDPIGVEDAGVGTTVDCVDTFAAEAS